MFIQVLYFHKPITSCISVSGVLIFNYFQSSVFKNLFCVTLNNNSSQVDFQFRFFQWTDLTKENFLSFYFTANQFLPGNLYFEKKTSVIKRIWYTDTGNTSDQWNKIIHNSVLGRYSYKPIELILLPYSGRMSFHYLVFWLYYFLSLFLDVTASVSFFL